MYPDQGKRNDRTFSGRVYGEDLNLNQNEKLYNTNDIRMPFFGVKEDNSALCVVIGQGADSARIDAQAGNEEIGYASVYTTFLIRGYDYIKTQNMHAQTTVTMVYSDEHVDAESFFVDYYPLSGDNIGYTDIAKCYRSALNAKEARVTDKESVLYLRFLGGMNVEKSYMGIPVQSFQAITKLSEAEDIISELVNKTDTAPLVQLVGYGESGLDIGVLGGDFTLSSKLGGIKEYQSLLKTCQKLGTSLYVDFDPIRYSSSGNGASGRGSAAFSSNRLPLKASPFSITTYNQEKDNFYLLRRDSLTDAVKRLNQKTASAGITGLSFKSLTSESYSDYRKTSTYVKNGFSAQVENMLKEVKNSHGILAENANAYAACLADAVIQAPTASDRSDGLDEEIPLYQIVFRGIVPMSGQSLNLAVDHETAFLQSMETGSGLCFTLCNRWEEEFVNCNDNNAVAFSQYSSWRDAIVEKTIQAKEYLQSVSGSYIVSHQILAEGVRQTNFSNGITVIVNYTEQPVSTPLGQVDANSFRTNINEGGNES